MLFNCSTFESLHVPERNNSTRSEVVLYPCRVLGFRKRAQSAEEESSASLQHLTLSEFLKEYVFHPDGLTAVHVWLESF